MKVEVILQTKNYDDITKVKYIDIRNSGITSLKGIEKCKSLETLYCSSNDITVLDYVDQLENLKCINLSHNRISDIKTLPNSLLELQLSRNSITDIDLSYLDNLQHIYLNSNNLFQFHLDCSRVYVMLLNNNKIIDLKLTNLQELLSIHMPEMKEYPIMEGNINFMKIYEQGDFKNLHNLHINSLVINKILDKQNLISFLMKNNIKKINYENHHDFILKLKTEIINDYNKNINI